VYELAEAAHDEFGATAKAIINQVGLGGVAILNVDATWYTRGCDAIS
jgi:hypothetical protein